MRDSLSRCNNGCNYRESPDHSMLVCPSCRRVKAIRTTDEDGKVGWKILY